MHIALLVNARLPVTGYGGTERVVTWLGRALIEQGHKVTLIASPGSSMPGATVIEANHRALQERDFDVTPLLPPGVDIVHSHRQLWVAPPVPTVWTLHGNPPPGTVLPANTIFVSANHARRYGHTAHVHNGLDLAEYRFRAVKGDYDLFLGRLHSVKGYRWAIEAARRTRPPPDHCRGVAPELSAWRFLRGSRERASARWSCSRAPGVSGCRRSGTSRSD